MMYVRYILLLIISFFKPSLRPRKGIPTDVKVLKNTTKKDGTTFCNYNIIGVQFCTYKIRGRKYFRFSFAKETKKFIWNLQVGANQTKYIFKNGIKWL